MQNKISLPHFLMLMLFTVIQIGAQETIKVWPDGVPGAIDAPDYRMEVVNVRENTPRLYKVTDPTLDLYLEAGQTDNGTAVIICPGGGYERLAVDSEGADVARWLNNNGISAFVLKYRLPSEKIMKDKSIGPLQDVQEAVRIVRRNATKWHIDEHKIGVMGFSAGGHLASAAATRFDEQVYPLTDKTSARPDFAILIYPVISMDTSITHRGSHDFLLGKNASRETEKNFSNELQVTADTPPAFMIHSFDDKTVPVENSIRYALALKSHAVAVELLLFEKGGHGYGMATGHPGTESKWTELCLRWLRTKNFR